MSNRAIYDQSVIKANFITKLTASDDVYSTPTSLMTSAKSPSTMLPNDKQTSF
jgi:hypothetical protein